MRIAPPDPDQIDPSLDNAEPFDWRHYLHVILERWWIVCLALLLGSILSVFLISREQTLYGARSVLFIEQQREKVLSSNLESVRDEEIRSLDMINTIVETLNSFPMAERVARRLDLGADPAFLRALNWSPGGEEAVTPEAAADRLPRLVKSSYREMTRLIDIVARTTDPQLSVRLANGYADEYLRMLFEQTTESTKAASQFLVEEATRLADKMRVAEESVQSFRERERAASLDTMLQEAQTGVDQITTEIQQCELLLRQVDNDLAAVSRSAGDTSQILRLPSVGNDPQIAQVEAQIAVLERELEEMSRRYREGHPAHSATKTRLEVLRGDLSQLAVSVVGQLEARRADTEARIGLLEGKRAELEKRLLEITGKSVEYNKISRNLEADRALYDSVLSRLKEVDVTSGLTDQSIAIQEKAFGAGPVPSQSAKYILLGVLGGLAAGIGGALALNYLDPSLRTIDQVERRVGLGVVAAIPQVKNLAASGDGGANLPVVGDRRSMVAEAFRTMRATLAMISGRDQNRVFLVTSAIPGEGKTFNSSNFAATLAQQGFRTLLIDADLRKPSIGKLLFEKNLKPGLSEVLMGMVPFAKAVVPTKIENLSVLPAGGIAPNPSELLSGPACQNLVRELREEYDRIVIDSSPVLAVRDPLLLSRWADASCLIVRCGHSPAKASKQAARLLAEAGTPAVGVVINGIRQGSGGYYAYTYRTYGTYGAKGVYGSEGVYDSKPAAVDPSA
jgi:capsular exopolysaccharide synthesis family protein